MKMPAAYEPQRTRITGQEQRKTSMSAVKRLSAQKTVTQKRSCPGPRALPYARTMTKRTRLLPPGTPFMTTLIKKVATRMGARVLVEPEFQYVGMIEFKNGRRTYYRNTNMSINTLGPVEIARDKAYASFFLKKFGYRVPAEKTFFSDKWCLNLRSRRNAAAACAFAKRLGFPVIVKPNNLSQGTLVIKAHSVAEVRAAAKKIFAITNVLVVQEFLTGRDYRLVVVDDEVISAYERTPLVVTGDGKSTVKKLLLQKQKDFIHDGRDTQLNLDDFRIGWKLKRAGMTMRSVLPHGRVFRLLDNANLSTGGDSRDVTESLHRDYKKLAVAVTKDMGLRLCGVDIMTSDATRPLDPRYVILEINAAPGLDHYASTGRKQQRIVEYLYEKVLRAIERGR